MRKKLITLMVPILAAATLSPTLSASGVDEQFVPSDVEWFLHIDVDTLRQSQAGSALIRELQAVNPLRNNPEIPIDPTLIINGLRGLSAFGSIPDLASGEIPNDSVLVIEGTEELMQVMRGLIAGIQLEKPEMLATLELEGQAIYQLQGESISGLFLQDSRIVIGQTPGALVSFLEVASGHQDHLILKTRFPSFKVGMESGFFVGAVIEGVTGMENLPAQARILQLTQAVSVQLGEWDEYLKLEAGLKTDDPMTARQVKDILQGIIALTAITQTGLPEVSSLIQSARVNLEDTTVALELAYPVASALGWIKQLAGLVNHSMEPEEPAVEELPAETGKDGEAPAEATDPATEIKKPGQ
ncbi:MAG TPA: hypothetical protein VJ934_01135 [Desulfomicrobiaceae bacterium]|nr:hypothetical protein [Desulfomicrobiaceae bacterium]